MRGRLLVPAIVRNESKMQQRHTDLEAALTVEEVLMEQEAHRALASQSAIAHLMVGPAQNALIAHLALEQADLTSTLEQKVHLVTFFSLSLITVMKGDVFQPGPT